LKPFAALYSYAAWVIRLLPNREVPADIEITEDMMRLHAFKIEQREAGSASLAAGDTIPLSPIKEFAAAQRLPLFRHSPCWSELGFCR
jgi:type I restriction enzyme, R subunit